MRLFVVFIALCGALWWADAHFTHGEYLQSLKREGLELKSLFQRQIDRTIRSISP
jgi:hypothetical protein